MRNNLPKTNFRGFGAHSLSADDHGCPKLKDGGWDIHGGAASKASFHLLGGYVEFDVDVSKVKICAETKIAPGFFDSDKQTCDSELDWVDQNGNYEDYPPHSDGHKQHRAMQFFRLQDQLCRWLR